jgi:SEC-C motif
MEGTDRPIGLGESLEDELPISQRCLEELRTIRDELAREHKGWKAEVFDFGLDMTFRAEKTVESRLEHLTRTCIWHAIALKIEFNLKLLYTIDGYLSAVDAKNPVSTFLLARYLLELAATVSAIDSELNACCSISDLTKWQVRGTAFMLVLYRARHSTSDETHKMFMRELGIPEELCRPIKIGKAIKGLASRPGFSSAVATYGKLSNFCHHNGTGHKMFTERVRETTSIALRNGRVLLLKDKAAAMTMSYPAPVLTAVSLTHTARVAWWSSRCAKEMIEGMREQPFSDKELRTISGGRLRNARWAYSSLDLAVNPDTPMKSTKIGRNEPCPCGSGKKYKLCCGLISEKLH